MRQRTVRTILAWLVLLALTGISSLPGPAMAAAAIPSSLRGTPSPALRAGSGAAPISSPFKAGELVVQLKADLPANAVEDAPTQYGAVYLRTAYGSDLQLWRVPQGQELSTVDRLNADPRVEYAEPNYLYHLLDTPNDPSFGKQWAHTVMQSPAAWDIGTGSTGITIAIIDTGIDETHPDLAARIVPGYDFWDYDDDPHDLNGHGTHVAGIAAAVTDNSTGVAGTDWQARIMPVRVLNEQGAGYNWDITSGINWAYLNGADVLSLSLGGISYSQSMQTAVNNAHAAGSLVVAAMGNCRTGCWIDDTWYVNPTIYPAALGNVMAVAATDRYDLYAPYSQYGSHCDIAAPGGDMDYLRDPDGIYSTMPTYDVYMTSAEGYLKNYDYVNGTSQSTPYVAGLAALLWSLDPALSPDEVQATIEDTAVDLGSPGWDATYGHGRIDPLAALEAVAAPAVPVAPTLEPISNPDGDGNYLVDWNAVSGAVGYTLEEDDDSHFPSPTVRYSGPDTQVSVTGRGPGTWYYRVRAAGSGGDVSPWSNVRWVTVKPNAPLLSSISNPDNQDEYTVNWSAATGATGYTLQEDQSSTFPSPLVRYDGPAQHYPVTGQANGTWYYRVRAYNAAGNSPWSTTRSTTVDEQPVLPAPTLYDIPPPPGNEYTVEWSAPAGATSYTLEQSRSPYFEAPAVVYSGSATQFPVTGQPGGTWHYRVRAFGNGTSSPWSDPASVSVPVWVYLPLVARSASAVVGSSFTEGFEAGQMPPANWEVVPGSASTWVIDGSSPFSGSYHASVYPEPSGQTQNEVLLSPSFLLSSALVQFRSFGSPYWCRDTFDNCDLSLWLVVGSWGGDDDIAVYTADQDWGGEFQYALTSVDLTSSLPPDTPVRLAFQYSGRSGEKVGLDAVELAGQ